MLKQDGYDFEIPTSRKNSKKWAPTPVLLPGAVGGAVACEGVGGGVNVDDAGVLLIE
jgi:hypothetical protein